MFEFVILGIPRTVQTKKSSSREQWKQKVAACAIEAMTENTMFFDEACSAVVIYYFIESTELDVDGIAKLILDGLKDIVFADDKIVDQVLVRKSNQTGLKLSNPTPVLAEALGADSNLVYVRIDYGANHSELPK